MRWRLKSGRLRVGALPGGLVLIVALTGVAVAAIPGGGGTVAVCVTSGGTMRAIDAEAGQTCPANQRMLTLATPGATVGQATNADTLDGKDSSEFGRVNQVFHEQIDVFELGQDVSYTTVATLNLPPGSYLLTANVDAVSVGQPVHVDCLLRSGLDDSTPFIDGAQRRVASDVGALGLALEAVVTHQDMHPYRLRCRSQNGDALLQELTMTALLTG